MNTKSRANGGSATLPNFWFKYEKTIPQEAKDWIYEQYLNRDTLYVYCDMSLSVEKQVMSLACSYLNNGYIKVKKQLFQPHKRLLHQNVYGEVKAVIFALKNFHNHIGRNKKVIIYSDIEDIEKMANNEVATDKPVMMKVQNELMQVYRSVCNEYKDMDISIQFLPPSKQRYNPYHKAANNAARRLLQE
ncbi:hypothetical protein AAXE64_27965 [Priestia megaterium]